jgi:hypothetical protein
MLSVASAFRGSLQRYNYSKCWIISRARALRAFSSAVRGPLSFDFDFDDFLALGK